MRTILLTLLLAVSWLLPADAGTTAIRAGRVLTGTGKVLTNVTIWVTDGKITAIDDREPGADVTVVDHRDATIIPGLVAATSQLAIRGGANDQSSEVTPAFRIAANLDGSLRSVRKALELGLTTAYVRPGLDNVVGGIGAVVRPGARGKAFVADGARELVVACGPWPSAGNVRPGWGGLDNPMARRPSTRMAVVWLIRKSFHDASVFRRTGVVGTLQKETPGAYTAAELRLLANVLDGKQAVRFVARADKDVRTAVRIAKEFGIPATSMRIEGVVEGYRGPAELAGLAGLVVEVVGSDPADASSPVNGMPFAMASLKAWFDGTHDPACACCGVLLGGGPRDPLAVGADTPRVITPSYGPRANNAAVVIGRNPRTALVTPESVPDLLSAAAYAVRHGLDERKALAAITRVPAQQLGMADQVGSIAVGKRADLVVLNGAPFEVTSRILAVYSDGTRVFDVRELLR